MTHPLAERDAVVTAVQELIEAALSGHGTALFVIGAAGLGKTTTLEHARRPGWPAAAR
jgi:Cdc6-like AAA superfamily ATPase